MKIAIVIERIETWRGGAETSTMEIARLLAARGHEVHIVTTTNAPSTPDLTIHRMAAPALIRSLRTTSFVKRAGEFIRGRDFDVVHAVSPVPEADIYQPRGGLLSETMARNVATRGSTSGRLLKRALMAMNVKQRSLLDLERRVFRDGGPLVLAVSNYVARQCERHYGASAPRVRVILNGVNTALPAPAQQAAQREAVRAQYEVGDGTLLLLFVAHNFRLKGLDPLIQAAGRLVAGGFEEFRILVVGRDDPTRFQRRLEELRLTRQVIFTGPTQRAGSFFLAADACVHPTYYDPCSRVVLEALSYGVPCLTTVFNGAAEVMQDGREGFVLPSPDVVDEWANKIRQMASEDLRLQMSRHALALREKLGMARHVSELESAFEEVARAKRGRVKSVSSA